MDENNEMLDLLKALAHADRLKIIGMLVQEPVSLSRVAAALSLSIKDAHNHLEFLKFVELVSDKDGLYHLRTDALEKVSRRQLEGHSTVIPPTHVLIPEKYKVLASFLKPDGSIRKIPNSITQRPRFRLVLEYIQAAFEAGVTYREQEVNAIIARFHPDTAGLRRDLVDAGLLARRRDGSQYWRVESQVEL